MDRTYPNNEGRGTPGEVAAGTLYVVGTPIGNLQDLSPRAREVLGRVDLVAAEDTRRTGRLLSSIAVQAPLIAYHEHNERERFDALLERLRGGQSIALVSDAGMPLVSDPGWILVHRALAAGIAVQVVPGPSAVTAALCVAGLPTDRFVFEGFLPRRAGARAARLEALAGETRTLVFFESVHRIRDTVAALAERFGVERRATLVRELTKVHEQVFVGTLGEALAALGESVPALGEFVIVVAGRETEAAADEAEVSRVFAVLSRSLPAERAVALTAELTGLSRNRVYRLTRVK
jgi:16S rRNA (cytidine1402-2'-O)-methyltransferase